MKRREVVIYAKTYDVLNDEGNLDQVGEIHILNKKQTFSNDKGVSNGHSIAQLEVPFDVAQKVIGQVPAICDIEYEITVVNKVLVLLPRSVQVMKEIESLIIFEETGHMSAFS
ncbi:hypothetical protein [Neobacillus vireti]|uniref:hypothetical protein n=1 Tax=Neobacillus vireti TaxID=220686 RepID=UPI003000B87F